MLTAAAAAAVAAKTPVMKPAGIVGVSGDGWGKTSKKGRSSGLVVTMGLGDVVADGIYTVAPAVQM